MSSRTASWPRAWRSETIGDSAAWYCRLSNEGLSALDVDLGGLRDRSGAVTQLQPSDAVRRFVGEDLYPVRAELESGRGFVVLTAGEPGRYSPEELQAIYWLVGQVLGTPFAQNVQGTLLYDVRDTGQDVRYGSLFSGTSAESTFHTDNSFGDEVLDYVGLLCLNPARSGGLSQLVNAHAVEEELRARHPAALEALRRPFHVDRRGGVRPGEG